MNYIRGAKDGSRKPLLAAVLICLFVYAGTLLEIPPMQQLVGWNDAIKDYQARKYGEPPFGHAETSSLKQFSAFLGLDSDLILQKMREADFKGEPKPESIFIDIATSNDMTPQELFSFIMKSTGATEEIMELRMRSGMPRGNALRYVQEKYGVNHMACVCAIDRATLPPLADYWAPGVTVSGVHELVANALVMKGECKRTMDLRQEDLPNVTAEAEEE